MLGSDSEISRVVFDTEAFSFARLWDVGCGNCCVYKKQIDVVLTSYISDDHGVRCLLKTVYNPLLVLTLEKIRDVFLKRNVLYMIIVLIKHRK